VLNLIVRDIASFRTTCAALEFIPAAAQTSHLRCHTGRRWPLPRGTGGPSRSQRPAVRGRQKLSLEARHAIVEALQGEWAATPGGARCVPEIRECDQFRSTLWWSEFINLSVKTADPLAALECLGSQP
jgi:hypothetical protein